MPGTCEQQVKYAKALWASKFGLGALHVILTDASDPFVAPTLSDKTSRAHNRAPLPFRGRTVVKTSRRSPFVNCIVALLILFISFSGRTPFLS